MYIIAPLYIVAAVQTSNDSIKHSTHITGNSNQLTAGSTLSELLV